jgi:diadenylate cyclase
MYGLLAFEDGVVNLFDKVGVFFTDFQFAYALEIFLLFCLIFYVSKILRDNDATRLMLLYWGLIVVVGAMVYAIDLELFDKRFYVYFVTLLSTFMLIMFSVEVKKSLLDLRSDPLRPVEKNVQGVTENKSNEDLDKCIADIIKALQNMSKNNVGGLVVLSRNNLPRQVLQSGVRIDSEISTQMIEGIFFPKSPLHDGAMIIRGHKIQAAGCFLPLTQKTNYPKDFGTRHRAGIGITEVANVTSIVVSEETGIISVIKQGNVQRYADYDTLKSVLKDYYWHELPATDKKK